jgi:hypothetical protein
MLGRRADRAFVPGFVFHVRNTGKYFQNPYFVPPTFHLVSKNKNSFAVNEGVSYDLELLT